MIFDFHVHSTHTPGGTLSLPNLANRVKDLGFDGFCLTDVNTVAGMPEARKLSDQVGLSILVGFEAHTDRGHFLVFVPDPASLPDLPTWLRLDSAGRIAYTSLKEAIEAREGVLIAAHPFDRAIPGAPGDALVGLNGINAVEVLNGRRPSLVNDLAEEVAAGVGLPGVGGSDVRTSLDELGQVATLVRGAVHSELELIDRIRSCDVWPIWIGALPISEPARERREPRAAREKTSSRSTARKDFADGERQHRDRGSRRPRPKPSR